MKIAKNELVRLIQSVKKRNKEDFGIIYDAYKSYSHFSVQKYCENKSDVEDIVQDAFITAYKEIHTLKKPEAFSKWFDSILFRSVVKAYRRDSKVSVRKDDFFESLPETKEEFLPESVFEGKEIRRQMADAVQSLPDRQRQVIIAFYFQQLKIKEIAEVLQIREGAVRKALHNARLSLEKRLAPSYRLNTFTLPLAYILQAEFTDFTVAAAEGGISAAAWPDIASKLKPPSMLQQLAANIGLSSTAAGAAAAVLGAACLVTGGISVYTQTQNPPEVIEPRIINTLEDMIGVEDAGLLNSLCDNPAETRERELTELLKRHKIEPAGQSFRDAGADIAEAFELNMGGKRLYVTRVWSGDRYIVDYHFGSWDEPELNMDELERLLD
jgi:RNA polymerase sigma-70 factor (ECF subfamily)